MAGISFNPSLQTNAPSTFGVTWDGLVQGFAMPDPAVRNALAGGILNANEALPMWGGVGISEGIATPPASPPLTPDPALGNIIARATNVTPGAVKSLTGFSVFDQAYGMINTPQSPVPLAPSGGQVMFYRLGSGARIPVAMAPVLIDLYGDVITQPVSWDFQAQQLVPFQAAFNANLLTNASWANTAGGEVTFTTTTSHGVAVGSLFEISGTDPSAYDGQYTAIAGTTGSTLVAAKLVDPGSWTSGGSLLAGGGALPAKIIKVVPQNSMVVNFDPDTGFATWNYNAPAALILI